LAAVAAHDGEPHDMAAFIRASQRHVWWLCAHLVDEDTADDLTQETYLRVFGNLLIGLSYDEAAAVCWCAVGTIRSRVARARADLITALDLAPATDDPPAAAWSTR
jgi:DNA-directed RNA polymerase specialized sigma24 family protein